MNRKCRDKEKVKDDKGAFLKDDKKPGFARRLRGFTLRNCLQALVQLAKTINYSEGQTLASVLSFDIVKGIIKFRRGDLDTERCKKLEHSTAKET